MDINQVEERAPKGTPRNLATIHENFSGFQAAASLQLRNLGRAGVETDVAVWWPLTLRISSERYVVRPERSGESAASPKLAAPAWRMPPRSGFKYTKIPAVGVEGMLPMGKCCQSQCWQFSIGHGGNAPPGRRLSQLVGARERPSPRGSPRTARPTAAKMAALHAGRSQLVATESTVARERDPPVVAAPVGGRSKLRPSRGGEAV